MTSLILHQGEKLHKITEVRKRSRSVEKLERRVVSRTVGYGLEDAEVKTTRKKLIHLSIDGEKDGDRAADDTA